MEILLTIISIIVVIGVSFLISPFTGIFFLGCVVVGVVIGLKSNKQ